MHGPLYVMAQIAIPSAGQLLTFAGPFIAVGGIVFVLRHLDQIIDLLFPHWDWERKLGWLNLRAQKQADAVLRWLGYLVYAVLAIALGGIVWSATILGSVADWQDSSAIEKIIPAIAVLLVSLGLWLIYVGCELLPKLRGQHEMEELEKFRADQAAAERERDQARTTRYKTPWPPPRPGQPMSSNRRRMSGE